LHVSNISLKVAEDELNSLFREYGEIYRIKLLKRGTMQKAFIDMDTEKAAQRAIDALHGYDLQGQRLEVKFSDSETAKQYPQSKFKKRDRQSSKRGDEGGYSGRGDKRDYRDEGAQKRGGFGSRGRADQKGGVNRSNTYDYDRSYNDRSYYNKGGRKYDDYDDYDDEDDYYEERQGGSYRRSGEKDSYRRGGYERRDDRGYRDGGRGGR